MIENIKTDKNERVYKKYFPLRYVLAFSASAVVCVALLAVVVIAHRQLPFLGILTKIIEICCAVKIVSSDDNPDYKVSWILFVLIVPVVGLIFYLLFYSRVLKRKYQTRLKYLNDKGYKKKDTKERENLKNKNVSAFNQAEHICSAARTYLFENTKLKYLSSGEKMKERLISDLKNATHFIFMEYFQISNGEFWEGILKILIDKVKQGVDVFVLYDDLGSMSILPANFYKNLCEYGIKAVPFSRIRGIADNQLNNRNHRKITVIDGRIAYTGGVNIADEYINKRNRFGHWKDSALRIEGEAVWEFTKLFLIDYGINVKRMSSIKAELYPKNRKIKARGYVVPFGDGPNPLYKERVAKSAIQNMFSAATDYVYVTTPYLIIDNDLCQSIENAARRGVDVRIILPHIPDKTIIFGMSRSFYDRLMKSGVKIYEYTPGFIHSKIYLADGKIAIVGTINLDYRSLVHHFENGVWLYECVCIKQIKKDIENTLEKSIAVTDKLKKINAVQKIVRAVVRIIAPLL